MPGDDFVDAIGQTLGSCDLVIVVIGPGWLSATNAEGRVRLQDPADFVRVEVAKALERHVRTVPVLVNRAVMPHEEELPEPLKPLIRRQAVELSDASWSSDVRELVDRIKRATGPADHATRETQHHDPPHVAPSREPTDNGSKVRVLAAVAGIIILAGVGGAILTKWMATSPATPQSAQKSALPPVVDKKEAPAPKEEPALKETVAPNEVAKARDTVAAAPIKRTEPAPKTSAPTAAAVPAPAPRNDLPPKSASAVVPAPAPVETKAPAAPPDPCEGRDADGCIDLARAYESGRGVPRDQQRAAEIYLRAVPLSESACERGRMSACANVGIAYMLGLGGRARDEHQAATFFQRACDGGNLLGCNDLGMCYSGGTGVPRDDVRAVEFYQRACKGGYLDGCDHLGHHYERGNGVRDRDLAQARALYQRSCDGGATSGCTDLGRMYETGIGVPKDTPRAGSLYQKACSAGDTNACSALKFLK